ncbi:sporulation protein [Streptosporangium sp. KLBMP 9127]|nr:sporulation protein [Streptosporangium sp. KLBMP 9127]
MDTVLAAPNVRPGQALAGEVRIKGGDFEASIEHVTLGLVVQDSSEDGADTREFFRAEVSGPFTLAVGEERTLPFEMPIPWETPLSEIDGQPLRGVAIGVRTELSIAKAVDKGDLDLVRVNPLPAQDAVLHALIRLGFQFGGTELETGHLYGVRRDLPFHQEIEFYPPPQYAGGISEIELAFVASEHGLEVILKADSRHGADAVGRFHVTHEEAAGRDWESEITGWLGHQTGGGYETHYGHDHHERHDHHDGHHGHHGGPGMGTVVAAGAVGVVGGLVAAEAIEEIFEEEEEEGEED